MTRFAWGGFNARCVAGFKVDLVDCLLSNMVAYRLISSGDLNYFLHPIDFKQVETGRFCSFSQVFLVLNV